MSKSKISNKSFVVLIRLIICRRLNGPLFALNLGFSVGVSKDRCPSQKHTLPSGQRKSPRRLYVLFSAARMFEIKARYFTLPYGFSALLGDSYERAIVKSTLQCTTYITNM